jgi:hypothetical protein
MGYSWPLALELMTGNPIFDDWESAQMTGGTVVSYLRHG